MNQLRTVLTNQAIRTIFFNSPTIGQNTIGKFVASTIDSTADAVAVLERKIVLVSIQGKREEGEGHEPDFPGRELYD